MPSRVGYAAGAFDLFHIGHLNLLRRARGECDFLIAGVVSDDLLEHRRRRSAVIPLHERLEIVSAIDCVDLAVAETTADKLEMWNELRFDVFFKGDDWRGTAKGRELERRFAEVGVEVVYFPYTVDTSSTALRRALAALNDDALAAEHVRVGA
jgi:glycerol-3-phosphate cytidylyltransferase